MNFTDALDAYLDARAAVKEFHEEGEYAAPLWGEALERLDEARARLNRLVPGLA